MKTCLSLFIITSIISSCGWLRKDSNDDGPSAVSNPIISIYPPDSYVVDDASCQTATEEVPLQTTGVQRWEGLSVTAQLSDLLRTKTAAQGALQSDAFLTSVYGREYTRNCDPDLYQTMGCIDPVSKVPANWNTVKNKGGSLRVCRDGYQYDRLSYEGVGLTSLHYVNQAREHFEKAGGQPLPRLILETLPLVKDVVKNFKRTPESAPVDAIFYHAHNAAYAQSEKGDEFIFIFPETKDLGYVPRGYLWESAFVLAHEFGHHIERHLLGDVYSSFGIAKDPFLHKYYSLEKQGLGAGFATSLASTRKVLLNRDVAGSFSEGFADLAGLYAMDGRLESLTGIECLGYNRNPLNGKFKDETAKSLTNHVISTLITGKSVEEDEGSPIQTLKERVSSCDIPRFTDIHVVGAILAYYINTVLASTVDWSLGSVDSVTNESPNVEAIRERYRILISAVQKVKSMINTHPQEIEQQQFDYFSRAVEAAVKEFVKDKPAAVNQVKKEQLMGKLCFFSKQTLPALTYVPFSNPTGQCANIVP